MDTGLAMQTGGEFEPASICTKGPQISLVDDIVPGHDPPANVAYLKIIQRPS